METINFEKGNVIDLYGILSNVEDEFYDIETEETILLHFKYNPMTSLFTTVPNFVGKQRDFEIEDPDEEKFYELDKQQLEELFAYILSFDRGIKDRSAHLEIDLEERYKNNFNEYVALVIEKPELLTLGFDIEFSVGSIVIKYWLSPITEEEGIPVIEEQTIFYNYDLPEDDDEEQIQDLLNF